MYVAKRQSWKRSIVYFLKHKNLKTNNLKIMCYGKLWFVELLQSCKAGYVLFEHEQARNVLWWYTCRRQISTKIP